MGNNACTPSPETIDGIFSAGQAGGIIPDITLDNTVSNYLSLNSGFALKLQCNTIQEHLSKGELVALNNNLTSIFGQSTKVSYGGVGIVALAMSFLFSTLVANMDGQMDAQPLDQHKRIFGFDNSSEISMIVREYLRLVPYTANDSAAMADLTDSYDQKLQLALIELYERMTVEHHLSTDAIKQWINGAAIHLHMRIHGVRLLSVPKGSAESLWLSYRTGLGQLFQLYASYLRHNVKERSTSKGPPVKAGFLITEPNRKVRHRVIHSPCQTPGIITAIVARILAAQNLPATETFFVEAGRNIDKLVHQQEHFELATGSVSDNVSLELKSG